MTDLIPTEYSSSGTSSRRRVPLPDIPTLPTGAEVAAAQQRLAELRAVAVNQLPDAAARDAHSAAVEEIVQCIVLGGQIPDTEMNARVLAAQAAYLAPAPSVVPDPAPIVVRKVHDDHDRDGDHSTRIIALERADGTRTTQRFNLESGRLEQILLGKPGKTPDMEVWHKMGPEGNVRNTAVTRQRAVPTTGLWGRDYDFVQRIEAFPSGLRIRDETMQGTDWAWAKAATAAATREEQVTQTPNAVSQSPAPAPTGRSM